MLDDGRHQTYARVRFQANPQAYAKGNAQNDQNSKCNQCYDASLAKTTCSEFEVRRLLSLNGSDDLGCLVRI